MKFFSKVVGHVTARDFNELADEVERLGNITAVAPLMVEQGSYGVNLSSIDYEIWGIITSSSTSSTDCTGTAWTFQEAIFNSDLGVMVALTDGIVDIVYEVNGLCIPIGTVVPIVRNVTSYVTNYCCGLSASSSSGSGSGSGNSYCIPFVQYAYCTETDGLVVTQKYLNITLPVGSVVAISDVPCSGSGS